MRTSTLGRFAARFRHGGSAAAGAARFRRRRSAAPLIAAALALLLLALTFAAGCGGSGDTTTTAQAPVASDTTVAPDTTTTAAVESVPAPEVAKIDLIMDWVPWVLDIPIDVAQAKGFYTDAGLTVTQTIPTGPTDVVKFVSTGKSQFGLYYAPDVLMARGEGAPVVSVAALMGHAPVGLALKTGLTAATPADLVGKTVAVPLIPSVRASFDSMLEAGGVDPSSVTLVDPGFDLVAPLLAGAYDAVAFTAFGELVEANLASGSELAYLDFRDWGTPDYAFMNVITSSDFAAESPNTVRAFVAATLAGLDYAATHPEEAVDLYVAAHPELDRDTLLAQWEATIPSLASASSGSPAGTQDAAAWQTLHDWMIQTGLLTAPLEVAPAVTNDFLPR
jgi:putative hydroxymethylpyrimidine transport system substrate-binding protein